MADIISYFYGLIIILALAASSWSYYSSKRRSDDLAKIARERGLSYEENAVSEAGGIIGIIKKINGNSVPTRTIETFLPDSEILKWGRLRSVSNLISGKINGREWKAFDYTYFNGSGRRSHTHCQTVFVAKIKGTVPAFVLCPEGLLDKLSDLVMKQDIDFENYPDFSKKYLLKGNNTKAVKLLFSPELINLIEKFQKKITLQSDGKMIAFFMPEEKTKAEEWINRIEDASKIFDLIDPHKNNF